jgi:hypothetical protein
MKMFEEILGYWFKKAGKHEWKYSWSPGTVLPSWQNSATAMPP